MYRSGHEPDPRFTLANERTFLAWIRTALGLVAAGVAVKALLDGNAAQVAAVVLVGSGAFVPAFAFLRWALSERALRRGRPLPAMLFGIALAVGLSLAGVVLVLAVIA
ncbi:YidH family protein [Phytohabitans kaempferiae]|uniref:YidH family protein n=1 Tax=Phytohabitans kaempferiae TaxID=1620943 RepID=A0ABV6MF99_9ACTN